MGKSKSHQKSAPCALQRMPVGSPFSKLQTELEEKTHALEAMHHQLEERDMELEDKIRASKALQYQLQERNLEFTELKNLLEEKNAKLKKIDKIADTCLAQWCWLGPSGQRNYFGKEANLQLESEFDKNGGSGIMNVRSGVYTYEINFTAMSQMNVDTGTLRTITRQPFTCDTSEDLEDVILHSLQTIQTVEEDARAAKEKSSLAESRVQALTVNLQDAQEGWEQDRTAKCRAEQDITHAEDARKRAVQQLEKIKVKLMEKEQELLVLSRKHDSALLSVSSLKTDVARAEAVAKKATEEKNDAAEASKQKVRADLAAMQRQHEDEMQHLGQAHDAEVSKFEEKMRQAKADAAKDLQVHCNKVSESLDKVAALWRDPKPFQYFLGEEPLSKQAQVCTVLKGLSHQSSFWNGAPSRCHGFQRMKILSVQAVHSPHLWKQYTKFRDDLKEKHRALGVDVQPLRQAFNGLNCLLPNHDFDSMVNEVILAHGCGEEAAKSILSDGWDIRFTNTNGGSLYGEGMYFGRQPCKCHQYTGQSNPRHMIISRVALGDPAYLEGEYVGRLPPFRDEANPQKGRHDSNVVSPDISRRGQSHWEYVIFDGKQAYPEMLITYEV